MSDKESYLTQEKHDELKKELDFLKTEKRKEIAENLEYSKSLGDLSENAEYHEARAMQAELEDRIAKLEVLMKNAVIVEGGKHGSTADIGSTVTLQKNGAKDNVVYTIVGSEEADLANNKISGSSPLGAALISKTKGDKVSVNTPKGQVKYLIIDVK
ncbi:MAG: transcription elongation factor GreA [Candidatus Taylorbacteria bacterium]|nr:transcription elongation factor GreA [Candidatus Taylorbacteria bacterium]